MLTPPGLIHAWLLGSLLLASSPTYFAYGIFYFIAGYLVTKLKFAKKAELGIAESRGGRRGPENVWGSAGVPLLLTFPLYLNSTPLHPVLPLAILGTFATKLSDTFASEIGKAYGKTTFLITTFRRVPPGTEGAVSLEGTVGGILGALVMTLCGAVLGTVTSYKVAGVVMLSAFLATSVESVIGATVQEGRLSNEMVNFIMCVIGAGFNIYFGRKVV